jgi:hypothetical protein
MTFTLEKRTEIMKIKFWGLVLGLSCAVAAAPLQAGDLPSFNLTIKDGRYTPELVEIPANQKVKLVVKNEGPGPEEFESSDLNREKVIHAGKTAEITIGPLKAGTYKFIGEFHPETAKGQIVAK